MPPLLPAGPSSLSGVVSRRLGLRWCQVAVVGAGAAVCVPSPGLCRAAAALLFLLLQLPAVRKSRVAGKPEWHFSVKSYVNLASSFFVLLIGLPQGGLFSHAGRCGAGVGQSGWGAAGPGAVRGPGGACRAPHSVEATRPGGSVRCWAPRGRAGTPAGQRSRGGNPRQTHRIPQGPWWHEIPSGSHATSGDPRTPDPPACSSSSSLSWSCAAPRAAELPGAKTSLGRETWGCSRVTSPARQVPTPAISHPALTCCPLPSPPELLGSAKKVNVNFQDTDG